MSTRHPKKPASVRALPEEVANKIAAGEVVERPASVVKELVENALDAQATRVIVRLVAAGRRTIDVSDNGHGMSAQDAVLAVERHTTSKIRTADDLDNILSYGFRGEALASIAAVSRFELVTRREKDEAGTRVRVEGAVLRDVSEVPAPVGTRVTVNRLYFNTPVRAKFLKGITTELSQCIDTVQRFALVSEGVAFQMFHNDKQLLDVPENASIRDRAALIWGLSFSRELIDFEVERAGMRFHGLLGLPGLTRSARTHQFFFLNRRPVVNRSLQYGFEDGYYQLVTIGRRPVGIVLIEAPPRSVDINIHPAKREIRFRDERAARMAMRDVIRERLADIAPITREGRFQEPAPLEPLPPQSFHGAGVSQDVAPRSTPATAETSGNADVVLHKEEIVPTQEERFEVQGPPARHEPPVGSQTEFVHADAEEEEGDGRVEPTAMYQPVHDVGDAPMQLFDTYLLVPEDERLLIIDQHALHERLTYDRLLAELRDQDYESQRLVVPILVDVPPSYVKTLESNLDVFGRMGIEIEPFGGNTFQVSSICHLYDESRVSDAVYKVLDHLVQGDLFSEEQIMDDLLRLAVEACRGSVKAGDRLTTEERRWLIDGFRRLRPPYTCPHGRPIITELTQSQMEKSFRRKQ